MGSLDYATATFIVPAAGFRPHKRDRLWIICKNMANTDNQGIWSCKRGPNVDYEGSGGERGANRGASSSHDEWHDTQTTKDERMVVANTSGIRGQNVSGNDKETAKRSSENENVKPSNSCKGDRGSEVVANTESSKSRKQTEWERGESVGGGGVDSIRSEDQRKDIERTTDVSDTNSNGSSTTKERGSFEETIHEEQTRQIGTLDIEGASDLSQATRDVANTNSEGLQGHGQHSELERESCTKQLAKESLQRTEFRQTMSNFCGIFNGISDWLDEPGHIQRTTHKNEHRAERLKQLGNALLPQITYRIGLAIKEIEDKNETT
jgi:hypothetical protein